MEVSENMRVKFLFFNLPIKCTCFRADLLYYFVIVVFYTVRNFSLFLILFDECISFIGSYFSFVLSYSYNAL